MEWFTLGLLFILSFYTGRLYYQNNYLRAALFEYRKYEFDTDEHIAMLHKRLSSEVDGRDEYEKSLVKEIEELKHRIARRNRKIMDFDPKFDPEEDA